MLTLADISSVPNPVDRANRLWGRCVAFSDTCEDPLKGSPVDNNAPMVLQAFRNVLQETQTIGRETDGSAYLGDIQSKATRVSGAGQTL